MTSFTQLKSPPLDRYVERRAKLFEAGDYPDKGVIVTSDHLQALAAGFSGPVPLLIEHADSPLEMGYLTAVERKGNELFGKIALTPEADALVERSGARALSLGLTADLSAIREVSLVRNPRVSSACLFSDGPIFFGELAETAPGATSHDFRTFEADRQVAEFVRRGKLTPAQAPMARALLAIDDAIEFCGERKTLRQIVMAMIERQPPHSLFSEIAPAQMADASEHLMLPEEAEFYRRHFPDVSLDEIAKRRNASGGKSWPR